MIEFAESLMRALKLVKMGEIITIAYQPADKFTHNSAIDLIQKVDSSMLMKSL
jgi:hypothetical protein